jgi:hypothetical protein
VHQLRSSQAEQQETLTPAGAPPEPYPRVFFWCVILILGLLNVWARRNEVTPDSVSYIELGWAAARGGLHQVVNAYWSPLYPFLLSLVFRTFHPGPQWNFTAAHLLNFPVYVASLASFELFLKELILVRQASEESPEKSRLLTRRTIWIWGYLFFLWASYFWLGPAAVTPDLCVAALVFLATALLLRIRRGRGKWLVFTGLGVLLGLGYLAKAAMFPLSFVFLFSAFYLDRAAGAAFRAAALRTLLAAGVFAAIALPLVLALSAQKGRPTFGDSAALNYAMYIDGAPRWVHWHGQPPGTGVPARPMRKLSIDPAVYEFAHPVPGSYPPWYDPSYWYEGIKPHFSLRGQAWAFYRAANVYLKLISRTGALYALFLVLVLLGRKTGSWEFEARTLFWVWLPSFAAFGMYALVHAEERFLSGFALMLLMWMLSSLRLTEKAGGQYRRRMILMTVLVPALAITWALGRDLNDVTGNKPYEPWLVAQRLHDTGIAPGTDVGYIGTGTDAYWAHLAGVRIIAEIPDKEQAHFVAADAVRRQQILALFISVGARAVLTRNAEAANPADGWRPIPGTHHFIWQEPWLIAAPEKKWSR